MARRARLRVGVLFGGRSGEHEVSLRSAWRVIHALDPARYEVIPVAITRDGRWWTGIESLRLLEEAQRNLEVMPASGVEVTIPPDPTRQGLVPLGGGAAMPLDVVFPVLHGPLGEDGTVQGVLELAGIAYVGAGVLASALGMDKGLMKSVFRDAGIPVCRWLVAQAASEEPEEIRRRVEVEFGFPCFVKPANLGSSVGISKVRTPDELAAALAEAVAYDARIVIEEAVAAREFECGVLGNDAPEASVIGEVVPSHEFYDYADKYIDDHAQIVIPAPLPAEAAEGMRDLALRAFRAIDCAGMARVDFFLEHSTGRVLVNEINTIPGFTEASMFPRLWEASDLAFAAVMDRLLALALERQRMRKGRRLVSNSSAGALSRGRRSSSGTR